MPDTSKLGKLNRELEKSEKKLRKAINDEKALQHQLKQLTSNGESLTSGKFRGEMRTLGSGVGTIDIYTVRDYGHLNSEHHGTLTGIEKYSQEEFDEHTQAGMSGNQPIGNASHN